MRRLWFIGLFLKERKGENFSPAVHHQKGGSLITSWALLQLCNRGPKSYTSCLFRAPISDGNSDLYCISYTTNICCKVFRLCNFIRAESFALYRLCTPSSYEARVNPHRASDSLRISVVFAQ